jgi:hypothetical protein
VTRLDLSADTTPSFINVCNASHVLEVEMSNACDIWRTEKSRE